MEQLTVNWSEDLRNPGAEYDGKTGVMWSLFLVPVSNLTAAFWTVKDELKPKYSKLQ